MVGGASVLLRDRHGNTPLHLACREGFFECAKALCIPISQEERQAALSVHHTLPPQALPQDLEQWNYDGKNGNLVHLLKKFRLAKRISIIG